jgi:uncharacterized protein (TIGR03067 family)
MMFCSFVLTLHLAAMEAQDLEKMQGEWSLVFIDFDHQEMRQMVSMEMSVVGLMASGIHDARCLCPLIFLTVSPMDRVVIRRNELVFCSEPDDKLTIRLEPWTVPKRIVLSCTKWGLLSSADGKPVKMPGIYRLEDDKLAICFDFPALLPAIRPKDFSSEQGMLILLEGHKRPRGK